jgi:hypothetical protein
MKPIKTKRWAIEQGFTRHGRLHGVPVWITDPEGDLRGPCVQAKNWLLDLALSAGEALHGLCVHLNMRQPVYVIFVGKRIAPTRGADL